MKRRLFLALPLDKRFFKSLAHYRDAHGRIPYLRWTSLANLHITVLFLGIVDEYRLDLLTELLEEAFAETSPFELTFDFITYAPRHRPANMVWAQFTPNPEFNALVVRARRAVSSILLPPDSSHPTPIPHCTLARFTGKVPQRPLLKLRKLGLEGERMTVESVVLFESRLRADGPQYRPLETFGVRPKSLELAIRDWKYPWGAP